MGALVLARRLWDRLTDLQTSPPRVEVSLGVSFKLLAVLLVVGLVSFQLGKCSGERNRDQWWRDSIAASSKAVRDAMRTHQHDIDQNDAMILKALEETDARLSAAEAELEEARNRPSPSSCPRVPAHCLQ